MFRAVKHDEFERIRTTLTDEDALELCGPGLHLVDEQFAVSVYPHLLFRLAKLHPSKDASHGFSELVGVLCPRPFNPLHLDLHGMSLSEVLPPLLSEAYGDTWVKALHELLNAGVALGLSFLVREALDRLEDEP